MMHVLRGVFDTAHFRSLGIHECGWIWK